LASSQAILTDVDLRYRNTFTTSQKLVWFNEEQVELFDVLEIDSPPYTFATVLDENFYPFPDGFDITKIKVVTYQADDTSEPEYVEVPSARNDNNQVVPYTKAWYTITSNAMYFYDGETVPADRNVYVYCDADPTEVTTVNIGSSPDLPTRYQEILKLGILKRISMARKDVLMHNNYDASYQEKIMDAMWLKWLKEPEWISPIDVNPKAGDVTYWNYPWGSYTPTGL
jgi:hypothetical protein